MRIVLQRVKRASVKVGPEVVGSIQEGMLLFLGIHQNDTPALAEYWINKCLDLRIFQDDQDKMNRSIRDVTGGVLVVSQFTLYGDCRKGRRPSFSEAAPPAKAQELYDHFVQALRNQWSPVATGVFGASMRVELVNDGPVTFILESE